MPVGRQYTVPSGRTVPYKSLKIRRLKTEKPLSHEVAAVQHDVYETLMSRLQSARIPLDDDISLLVEFLQPCSHAALWRRLLQNPITVTTDELSTIFELEESVQFTPSPPLGTQIYYIRSFELTTELLLQIVTRWEQEGRHPEECKAWRSATRFIKDRKKPVFIRYVGTSTVISAFERFATDLARREGGLYGHFREELAKITPNSPPRSSVHTFTKATTKSLEDRDGSLHPLHVVHTDIREQALIALFDRSTLLNRQVGGVNVAYQPEEEDLDHFARLTTNTFRKLLEENNLTRAPPTATMQLSIRDWMRKVCALGEAHSEELGTDQFPVTDDMILSWTQQATPCTVSGYVIVLFIGDYCPVSAMKTPQLYWKQPLRSVKYLKDTLARLKALEGGKTRWDSSDINCLVEKAILPWINYQYTPKRDDFREDSAELMRQYLAAVKPLIVLSFERRTSGVLRADFAGIWSKHDFHPDVGTPAVQRYTWRGQIFDAGTKHKRAEIPVEEQDCYIQIPSIHPGADRYDEGSKEQRRVFDMTMWQLVLMIECALDLLSSGFEGNRSELCAAIMAAFQDRWTSSGNAFAFTQAKRALADWYQNKKGRYSNDSTRALKDSLDGTAVSVNLSGIVNIYWNSPSGKRRLTIAGGRGTNVHPPKGAQGDDAVRTIHL